MLYFEFSCLFCVNLLYTQFPPSSLLVLLVLKAWTGSCEQKIVIKHKVKM